MAGTAAVAQGQGSAWLRWFPATETARPGWFRLVRFASVDGDDKPIGKPIVALTPSNHPRMFRTEGAAAGAAVELNRQDGL